MPTIRKHAVELAALAPDVIVATGGPTTAALLKVTASCQSCSRSSPIQSDFGFVDSLSRPGRNATGG